MNTEVQEHETVGRMFRSLGLRYVCTRWERAHGFWMRVVARESENPLFDREVGHETCVSERAIGATFHRLHFYEDESPPIAHEQPCNCWICEGRPRT